MRKLTPVRAIKLYCKEECNAGDLKNWKECQRRVCPLFSYRLGKRPMQTPKPETSILKQGVIAQESIKTEPSGTEQTIL